MAVFVSGSDETTGSDGRGLVSYMGYLAPESDWTSYFAPAWDGRVLAGPPRIPYLHMTEIRSPKWRTEYGLSRYAADCRVDAAVKVIDQMGSLYPVSSTVDGTAFRQLVKARVPRGKGHVGMRQPDFYAFSATRSTCLRQWSIYIQRPSE